MDGYVMKEIKDDRYISLPLKSHSQTIETKNLGLFVTENQKTIFLNEDSDGSKISIKDFTNL